MMYIIVSIDTMSFIRYQKFWNKVYAYEVTSYWDSVKRQSRQKVKYIGVVNQKKGIIEKRKARRKVEKLILDFGDTYLLYKFMKKIKLTSIIEKIFGERTKMLLSLICYRLCHPGAMNYAKNWFEGNIARLLFPEADLSSQRISEFLQFIGDESVQREFFKEYISSLSKGGESVIIDTTALPNQIRLSFNSWGYSDGEIEKQIKILFVVDKETHSPLIFRYLPGNVVDVSSLNMTIEELKRMGIKHSFVIIDAGFFSEDNIKGLYDKEIDFLTRLPCGRILYKELIKEEADQMERFENGVRYGKRALFVKRRSINLFGKEVEAYIVLDPERKGREIKRFLLNVLDEERVNKEEIESGLKDQGIMILISSFKIENKDIIPLYYMRHMVETLFGFSKDDLKLIPLRVHKEETLRGYLLVIFITLIVFVKLKKEMGEKYTVEEVMMTMRNLKCKIYENEILVQELTRQQKEITKILNIIVSKVMGI